MIILVSEYLDYYTKTLNLKLYNDIRVVNNKEGLEIFKKRNSIECLELILLNYHFKI